RQGQTRQDAAAIHTRIGRNGNRDDFRKNAGAHPRKRPEARSAARPAIDQWRGAVRYRGGPSAFEADGLGRTGDRLQRRRQHTEVPGALHRRESARQRACRGKAVVPRTAKHHAPPPAPTRSPAWPLDDASTGSSTSWQVAATSYSRFSFPSLLCSPSSLVISYSQAATSSFSAFIILFHVLP